MTVLLVTTVRRNCPPHEPSGYVYALDWAERRVLRRTPMIETLHRPHDPNTRGGVRGAKGIGLGAGDLFIANYSHVFRFSANWEPMGAFTHPSCASIHDIELHEGGLWVTSSRNDLVFQFDLEGRMVRCLNLRDDSAAQRALRWRPPRLLSLQDVRAGAIDFRDPRTHDLETYDAAHVNSLCVLPNGDMLVSLGIVWGRMTTLFRAKKRLQKWHLWSSFVTLNQGLRKALRLKSPLHSQLVVQPAKARSGVVRVRPDGACSLCLEIPGVSVPSHSLRVHSDGTVLFLNTSAGAIVQFDPAGRADQGTLLAATNVSGGFLRGLAHLSESVVVVGNKTELLSFDVARRQVVSRWTYTSDASESVFDVKVLPAHFALPPAQFPDAAAFEGSSHAHPAAGRLAA